MGKQIALIESENKDIIDAVKKYFGGKCRIVHKDSDLSGYKLIVLTGYDTEFRAETDAKILNLHPSLLPAFACENALSRAFLSGVRVSGITIHEVVSGNFYGKILAQYPVLIGLTAHFDEFAADISAAAKKLYPPVIDAVINDKVFDFTDLFRHPCQRSCSRCSRSL